MSWSPKRPKAERRQAPGMAWLHAEVHGPNHGPIQFWDVLSRISAKDLGLSPGFIRSKSAKSHPHKILLTFDWTLIWSQFWSHLSFGLNFAIILEMREYSSSLQGCPWTDWTESLQLVRIPPPPFTSMPLLGPISKLFKISKQWLSVHQSFTHR